MARVSFTVRRPIPDHGSYVRFDPTAYETSASAGNAASAGTWETVRNTDQYLRSDGVLSTPASFSTASLSATSFTYGKVLITWEVPMFDTQEGTVFPVSAPDIVDVVLVYSPYGEPYSLNSGQELVTDYGSTKQFIHDVSEGSWSYYSIFAHYVQNESGSITEYYERLGSIKVIVPRNYNSTALLWNRIPEYYRYQDYSIGIPISDLPQSVLNSIPNYSDDRVGPLYRFISIFGFDLDKVRTIIDYMMVSRDPSIADTETLDALAYDLGFGLSSSFLGTARLRSLMDDIGTFIRNKGTKYSFDYLMRSLSGGLVDVDVVNNEISIYAQRVNYAINPKNMTGRFSHRPAHLVEAMMLQNRYYQQTYDPSTYSYGSSATYPQPVYGTSYYSGMHWTAASAGTMGSMSVSPGDTIVSYGSGGMDFTSVKFGIVPAGVSSTTYSSYSPYTVSVNQLTPGSFSDDVSYALIRILDPVPVKAGDRVVFSIHSDIGTYYLSDGLETSVIQWARLVDSSGNVISYARTQVRSDEAPAFSVSVPTTVPDGWSASYVEILVDLSAVKNLTQSGVLSLTRVLMERNHNGNYFDGSSVTGSWLVEDGSSLSDYRWSVSDNASVSMYTDHYTRIRSEIDRLKDEALPITEVDKYTIVNYSKIPGQELLHSIAPGTVPSP